MCYMKPEINGDLVQSLLKRAPVSSIFSPYLLYIGQKFCKMDSLRIRGVKLSDLSLLLKNSLSINTEV